MKKICLVLFVLAHSIVYSQISQQWAQRYNYWTQNGNDSAAAMVLDDSANVLVTGSSIGTSGFTDYLTIKYSTTGSVIWSQRFNGGGNWHDFANAIATDDSGNVYVTGTSFGGGMTPTNNYLTIKYSNTGVQQWIAEYDRAVNYDEATSVLVDDSGYVFVTGFATATTGEDFLTIKYDSNGNLIWSSAYDGPANNTDRAIKLQLDTSGNVYVSGRSLGVGTGYDYATVKYNSAGVQQWAKRFNGAMNNGETMNDLTVDMYGNVYVTGYGFQTNQYGEYATVKYDTNGNQSWIALYGGIQLTTASAQAIVVDTAGNVYVTGLMDTASAWENFLTVKYNSAGIIQWSRHYDGPANSRDKACEIALDEQGFVYVTGSSEFSPFANSDYATIKYDPLTGNQVWLIRYNGTGNSNDIPVAIAVDILGNVYVSGYSNGGGTGDDYATVKYSYITADNSEYVQDQIGIFPNPCNGQFSIVCAETDYTISLYDMAGNVVYRSPGRKEVDVSFLPGGIYLAQLSTETEILHSERIVIVASREE